MRITWVGVPKEYRKALRSVLRDEHVGREFLVCSDRGADQKAKASIRDSAWAFNDDFIAAHARRGIDADSVKAIKGNRCEDATKAVLAIIKSFKAFAEDAIACDGRGHFLNPYDGNESEARVFNDNGASAQYFYIYRTN